MVLLEDLFLKRLGVLVKRVVRHLERLLIPKLRFLITHLFLLPVNDEPILVHEQVERCQSVGLEPFVYDAHFRGGPHRLVLLVGYGNGTRLVQLVVFLRARPQHDPYALLRRRLLFVFFPTANGVRRPLGLAQRHVLGGYLPGDSAGGVVRGAARLVRGRP